MIFNVIGCGCSHTDTKRMVILEKGTYSRCQLKLYKLVDIVVASEWNIYDNQTLYMPYRVPDDNTSRLNGIESS